MIALKNRSATNVLYPKGRGIGTIWPEFFALWQECYLGIALLHTTCCLNLVSVSKSGSPFKPHNIVISLLNSCPLVQNDAIILKMWSWIGETPFRVLCKILFRPSVVDAIWQPLVSVCQWVWRLLRCWCFQSVVCAYERACVEIYCDSSKIRLGHEGRCG